MPTASIHQDRFNISPFLANLYGHEKWAKTALRAASGASMNPSFPNSETQLFYLSLRCTGWPCQFILLFNFLKKSKVWTGCWAIISAISLYGFNAGSRFETRQQQRSVLRFKRGNFKETHFLLPSCTVARCHRPIVIMSLKKKEAFWNRQLGRLALQATVQCLKLIIRCYDEQNTGALNTASNNRINNRLLNVTWTSNF